MDEETTITQGLHVTDDSAGYDAACKRVLSEKAILARIMKSCLEEYKDCDVNDIAGKYIEGQPQVSAVPVLPDEDGTVISGMDTEDKSVHEGTVTYDIRFRAIVPGSGEQLALIINVEAQNDFYPGYPLIKRGIYYCCRMISSQYGREFTGPHYEKIKKVYSIWICMKPPQYREEYHHRTAGGGTPGRRGQRTGQGIMIFAVHHHAVLGGAGRGKLRRYTADAGRDSLQRNQRGGRSGRFCMDDYDIK